MTYLAQNKMETELKTRKALARFLFEVGYFTDLTPLNSLSHDELNEINFFVQIRAQIHISKILIDSYEFLLRLLIRISKVFVCLLSLVFCQNGDKKESTISSETITSQY